MKAMLYLVAQADRHIPYCEFFDSMEIKNEYQLRQFYREQIDLGYIHPDNLKDHDITVLDDPNQIDIDAIVEVLNSNDEYDEDNTYYISQQLVNITDDEIYD